MGVILVLARHARGKMRVISVLARHARGKMRVISVLARRARSKMRVILVFARRARGKMRVISVLARHARGKMRVILVFARHARSKMRVISVLARHARSKMRVISVLARHARGKMGVISVLARHARNKRSRWLGAIKATETAEGGVSPRAASVGWLPRLRSGLGSELNRRIPIALSAVLVVVVNPYAIATDGCDRGCLRQTVGAGGYDPQLPVHERERRGVSQGVTQG